MNRIATSLALLLSLLASWAPGGLAVNVLIGTDNPFLVSPREYLYVSDKYYLVFQPDCNLVFYNSSRQPIVNSGQNLISETVSHNCSLVMQADGNLVIYNYWREARQYVLWAQNFYNIREGNRSFLLLGADGSLNFYNANSTLRQPPLNSLYDNLSTNVTPAIGAYPQGFDPTSSDYTSWTPKSSLVNFPYMPAGYFLSAGNRMQTMTQAYFLDLGDDCNLTASQKRFDGTGFNTLWQSHTNTPVSGTCQLTLLQNGMLQVRSTNSSDIYWNSTKTGDTSVSWILKLNPDNGSLSVSDITNDSNVLWSNSKDSLLPIAPPPIAPPPIAPLPVKSNRSVVGIVIGVIGGAFVLAMVALGFYFYKRRSFLGPADKAFQVRMRASGGHSQAFSQSKIKQATRNYGNVIGRGGFGDVFYGKLPDGQEVAAKVLSATSHQSKQEFYNEIELLSKVHHKHLVSLLGYSCTRKHQILIYEYMAGGDLRQRLQGESGAASSLSWQERTRIILQVAEGLEYLHDKCSPPIIHRDIKSTNILLTSKLVAKVADFGLSKLKAIGQEDATHVTTVVKGTPGYLDPEYHETGMLTEKSDVYAFGVVIMEILTGRHHMHIVHRVGDAWRRQQADGLADPNLGEDFKIDELVNLVELALWCVRRNSIDRPFMPQVVRRLNDLLFAPSGESQPSIDLLDMEGPPNGTNIELVTTDFGDVSSETLPLSGSSSSFDFPVRAQWHTRS